MKIKLPIQHLIKYIAFLIVLVLVVTILTYPNYRNLKSVFLTLTTEAQSLESRYIAGEGLEKSSDDYKLISDKLPLYESLFIKQGEELLLVKDLEELAEKNNLVQKLDLGLNSTKLDNNIIQVPFNFILEGSFKDFLEYLNALYEKPYNLSIQNLDIKQTENSELEIHLLGYTYWLIN